MPGLNALGETFRVRAGSYVAAISESLETTTLKMAGFVSVLYDDGTDDLIQLPDVTIGVGFTRSVAQHGFNKNGWVTGVGLFEVTGGNIKANMIYIEVGVWGDAALTQTRGMLAAGYLGSLQQPVFGHIEPKDRMATWVFQGTVAEDATAGTHVCTLTVTPGAGNEMLIVGGYVILNGAANLSARVTVDDGANETLRFVNQSTAGSWYFPIALGATSAAGQMANPPMPISGAMRLVLRAQTDTVSQTHTFAIVCRIRGAVPTATLADTVGTPVLTTNTSAVF